ncbi:MAG: methyl-accepting chemotaxis protein [Butyrivibrio sp.]|nr:methyl-accepting chemotaxis protein [Butyrivibrio sp.]
MKKLGIKAKMLLVILPIVVIALAVLTYGSIKASQKIITEAVVEKTESYASSYSNQVDGYLSIIRATAVNLSRSVSATYETSTLDQYEALFSQVIQDNDMILGSGIWFEPYAFDATEEYVGPYWYRDGGNIVETMEYSNADYNYFVQEYYTNAKAQHTMKAMVTDPYYDETSKSIMATCSAPILGADGAYLGCITVDLSLDTISNMAGQIQVGETGRAILVTSEGVYLYTDDNSKVSNGKNIRQDDNSSLAQAAATVLATQSGATTFKEGRNNWYLAFNTIPEVNWKLMIKIAESEMYREIYALRNQLIFFSLAVGILIGVVIVLMLNSVTKSLANVKQFAGALAGGDFTVEKLSQRSEDELGQMSQSLNNMFESNRSVIRQISDESTQINRASADLTSMAGELTSQFDKIRGNMSSVNDAMMSSGAATEEVSASVAEVNSSVQNLSDVADESSRTTKEIKTRATQIEANSQKAYENAIAMVAKRREEMAEASESAKVVNEINDLTNAIASIASQIELLSLNASIEAARAGEHGRGFAVVASEINKLAADTADSVSKIQHTIEGVQYAFSVLSASAQSLLDFLNDTVAPDYDHFVGIGRQYGADAETFGHQSEEIAEMVENIRHSMSEVNNAIQNIAESTQETAGHSAEITESIGTAAEVVEDVSRMSGHQGQIAETLDTIVKKFKL